MSPFIELCALNARETWRNRQGLKIASEFLASLRQRYSTVACWPERFH